VEWVREAGEVAVEFQLSAHGSEGAGPARSTASVQRWRGAKGERSKALMDDLRVNVCGRPRRITDQLRK